MRKHSSQEKDLLGVFGAHLENVRGSLAVSDSALAIYAQVVTLSYWCNNGVFIPWDDLPGSLSPCPPLYKLIGSGLIAAVFDSEGVHAGYRLPIWEREVKGQRTGLFAEHLMIR